MPIYKITETRSITCTYTVEAEDAETAVEEYEEPDRWTSEPETDEASVDTEVIAVEDEAGNPVGEWVMYDRYGNQGDGHPTREGALSEAYPSWIAPTDDDA